MDGVRGEAGRPLAEERRGDGLELFMRLAGLSEALDRAADAIAASIPQAVRQTIEGQTHVADPKLLAPVLERFLRD